MLIHPQFDPVALSLGPVAIHWYGISYLAAFMLFVAFMMVSRIPTYAGKTLGSRVPRTWVMPLFVTVVAFVALLVTYTFEVLTVLTAFYLILIPLGFRQYRILAQRDRKLP